MGYSKKVTTRGMVPNTQELVMTILHGVFFQILVDNPTAPPPMGGPVPTQEKTKTKLGSSKTSHGKFSFTDTADVLST